MAAAGTFTVVIDPETLVGGTAVSGRLTARFQNGANYASFGPGDLKVLDKFSRTGRDATQVAKNYNLSLPTDVASGGSASSSTVGYEVIWYSDYEKGVRVKALFTGQPAGSTVYLSALADAEPMTPLTVSTLNADRAEAAADRAEAVAVPIAKRKTTDTTRNNTVTRTADPELTVPVDPGTYVIDAMLIYNGSATADMRVELLVPSGSTLLWTPNGPHASATGVAVSSMSRATATAGSVILGGVGADVAANPVGTLIVTTPGDVSVSWAQSTQEASNLTVKAGSYLRLMKVPDL